MEDIFVNEARNQFINFFDKFQTNMLKLWPQCEEAKDLNILFTNVIKSDEERQKQLLAEWYDNLTTPLSKKVKYYKPLERILKQPPTLYHACEYNDIDGVEKTSSCELLTRLDLYTKYKADVMSVDDKKVFWKYLRTLNDQCLRYHEQPTPVVPSREQIQNNIKEQKSQRYIVDESPCMNRAFHTALVELCKSCGIPNITEHATDETMDSMMNAWVEFVQDSIDNAKVPTLCNQKDEIVFPLLKKYIPAIDLEDFVMTDEIWNLINQLNGYAAVNQNIPTKMMGKIENFATKLADDIMQGRADLSSMNLNEIGQEVLSQCDESDMNAFANNIDSLLPALQHFQKSM